MGTTKYITSFKSQQTKENKTVELLADVVEMGTGEGDWIFALVFNKSPFSVSTVAFEDVADVIGVYGRQLVARLVPVAVAHHGRLRGGAADARVDGSPATGQFFDNAHGRCLK